MDLGSGSCGSGSGRYGSGSGKSGRDGGLVVFVMAPLLSLKSNLELGHCCICEVAEALRKLSCYNLFQIAMSQTHLRCCKFICKVAMHR